MELYASAFAEALDLLSPKQNYEPGIHPSAVVDQNVIIGKEAIIAALLSKKGERIYSLRFNGLDDLIKIEQEKIDKFDKKDIKTIEHKDKMWLLNFQLR